MSESDNKTGEVKSGKVIVVAVDGTPMADHAVKWAARLVNSSADQLRLLHVQTPSEHHDEIHELELVGPLYHVGKEVSEESIKIVSHHLRQCNELNLINYKEDVITQKVGIGKSIVSYVAELAKGEVSLDNIVLVLGSREIGFFEKAFFGSVGDYCVHNAPCPVFIAKLPKPAAGN
jgi:nucleotide-binding universal stress UspA family protein